MSQESRPFNNSGLFSNHYLENLIQSNPEWNQDEKLVEVFTKIKDRFHRREKSWRPARREPGEALRAEFEDSVGKLLPLLERIGQTDKLIDQIVYRLYGLTEEEIEIVEGTVQ
jgi:hypothetical protein